MNSTLKSHGNAPDHTGRFIFALSILVSVFLIQSCGPDDPKPVNEEEVITTMTVTLIPGDGGMPVILTFFDEDGENGSMEPVQSVSGSLRSATSYSVQINLLNETVTPAADVSEEVENEGNDHLFCFSVSGDIAIQYEDSDDEGMPLGLATSWLTGEAGQGNVTISLRHQAGTKNGDCPGTGETDLEVSFSLIVQ